MLIATVEDVFNMLEPNSDCWIIIRDQNIKKLSVGHWYEDKILDYADCDVSSFTWQNDNKIFIDIEL